MPTRIVREGILTSERVNALTPNAELFYRRVMSVVDDFGRYSANLTLLRASCYPLKLDSVKEDSIKKHLTECADAGLIVLYTVADKAFLELQDFRQQVRAKDSKYPAPDAHCLANDKQCLATVHLDEDEDEDDITLPKRSAKQSFDKPSDVSEQVWTDFKALRKAKKAALTETALNGIRREADKAGYSLEQALAVCCERGWQSFKADWVAAEPKPQQSAFAGAI